MDIVVWLTVGGVIGWVASLIIGTDGRDETVLIVVVGSLGAALGGWLFGSAFHASTISEGDLRFSGLMVSLAGAVLLITVMRLIQNAVAR